MNILPTDNKSEILSFWRVYLYNLSYVRYTFVESSLVNDTVNIPDPASDIDMRIVVADNILDKLRADGFSDILHTLGVYCISVNLVSNKGDVEYQIIRVLTENGIVISLGIYKESDANSIGFVPRRSG